MLTYDADELTDLIETLQFHLHNNELTPEDGWQRPLFELDEMNAAYQEIIQQSMEAIIRSNQSPQQELGTAKAMQADIRRLKTKLKFAIGMVM